MPQTPEQVRKHQKAEAEKVTAAIKAKLPAPTTGGTAVAVPDSRTAVEKFQDDDSNGMMPGRPLRFNGKDGYYYFADDDSRLDENTEWIAPVDEMAIGVIKFCGKGNPPEVKQGLPYRGYRRPEQEELPDRDENEWPIGLSGLREDPWRKQSLLVLQNAASGELATFSTTSTTGLSAVAALSRHYDRMQKTHPDTYPIVRCKLGGYEGKFGHVHVPIFTVVGRYPKAGTAKPDTSLAADMNDSLPV